MAPVWYVDSRGESTMAKSERQKLKLLILRDYLRSHTDEQHPVSMQQILAALEGEGIRAERKSVYDDLDTLRDYGMEIRKVSGKNGGYYVPERDFALSELKLLVDAVQAARFLSEKESMALIRKLAALSSAHEAELLRREVVVTGRAKSGSEDVCRNVDTLHAAIAGNSRITFRYFDWDLQGRRRFRPKTYEASPIALCWEDENYYLVAYGAPHGLTHYRVDKMTEITATGVPRESNDETRSFDPAVYSQQVFGMFRGEQCRMKLRFETRWQALCSTASAVTACSCRTGRTTLSFRRISPFHRRSSAGSQASAAGRRSCSRRRPRKPTAIFCAVRFPQQSKAERK